jgi:hypothetical protein
MPVCPVCASEYAGRGKVCSPKCRAKAARVTRNGGSLPVIAPQAEQRPAVDVVQPMSKEPVRTSANPEVATLGIELSPQAEAWWKAKAKKRGRSLDVEIIRALENAAKPVRPIKAEAKEWSWPVAEKDCKHPANARNVSMCSACGKDGLK